MSTVIALFTIALFSLLILLLFLAATRDKRYHPVGGTILSQLINFTRLHDHMTDLTRENTTYRLITFNPFRSEVYTSDPANVEYVLKTNFTNFGKGWYNYSILKDLLGDGIFAVDGERWREQRKVLSHEFSARALRDTSSIVFKENAVKLAGVVFTAAVSDQPVDIQDLFMKSTLDSIFRVAIGVELDSMCGSNEEGARFSRAFDDASEITAWRYVDVLWKIKKYFSMGLEGTLKERIRVIDEFVYKVIHKKTQQMQHRRNEHNQHLKKEDILSRYMQLSGANPKYLRDIILNFVMAGKDTTATTLSWFFYMLCKHRCVQETAVKEIEEVMGVNRAADVSEFAGNLNEEALEKMHYLHSALTETLRLYPPVPVDPKMCFEDDILPDGFHVKRGDTVAYQPYAMGRMRFIWGHDAEEFRPERWLDGNGCFRQESPFKFTAFQAGPRICLGKGFAYRQMKILSAVLLRFFIFELSDDSKPVKYRTMINLHIDGGLSVRAFPRLDKIFT